MIETSSSDQSAAAPWLYLSYNIDVTNYRSRRTHVDVRYKLVPFDGAGPRRLPEGTEPGETDAHVKKSTD